MDISSEYRVKVDNAISSVKMPLLKSLEKARTVDKIDDSKKIEFAKAARGFEAMFVNMMFKEMKKAQLEEKESDFSFGANTLGSWADILLSEEISNQGTGIGIAEKIYENLTGGEKLPVNRVINPEMSRTKPEIAGSNFLERVNSRIDDFAEIISGAAVKYDLSENLIKAVIAAESAGKKDAVSSAGAKGLMQLMDGTADYLGISDSFNPDENIDGGSRYLRMMLDKFDGNIETALAAYNAGPGNVLKYGGVPPFRETEAYIKRVLKYNDLF